VTEQAGPPPAQETIAAAVEAARRLRSAGRLDDAVRAYRAILNQNPSVIEALNGLGIALAQLGRFDEAAATFRTTIEKAPNHPEAHNNLGNALSRCGRLDDAIEAYRSAIRFRPAYETAQVNLGMALLRADRPKDAEVALRSALLVFPQSADAHYGLGTALRRQEKNAEAAEAFASTIRLRPNSAEAHNDLGDALHALGNGAGAEAEYREAIRLRPTYAEAHTNLGVLLGDIGRVDEGIAALETAIAIKPDLGEAYSNLGSLEMVMGRAVEAERALRAAVSLRPNLLAAHLNLGSALYMQRRFAEAETVWQDALRRWPDSADLRLALGEMMLMHRDYVGGWREFEWRWKTGRESWKPRDLPQPRWAGEPLDGKTVLLYGEQGFGDLIQFVRYAPAVAARGGKVILDVFKPLVRLLATAPGVSGTTKPNEPLPPFDFHLPLMSVPGVLGDDGNIIPSDVPYLAVDPQARAQWRDRLAAHPGLKVGVSWASGLRPNDPYAAGIGRRKTMALSQMLPILTQPGITSVSLQKDESSQEIAGLPETARPLDFMAEIGDFADTAALIDNLDLVISVDTAIAHLAGALAKPVWILVRYESDWRWDEHTSPWYPTARIFRQSAHLVWEDAVARVAAELARYVASAGTHRP
jgi:Flp pilus assembly protein TadD